MSVLFDAADERLHRETGGFLDPTQDFTVMVYGHPYATFPASGKYRTFYQLDNDPGTDTYIGFYQGDTGALELYAANGIDPDQFIDVAGDVDRDFHLCFTYESSSTTFTYYFQGMYVGTFVLDMSGATFTSEKVSSDDALGWSGFNATYLRTWQRKLSAAEIENFRRNATLTTGLGLFVNLPLATDAVDVSGNGRDFTASSGVSYLTSAVTIDVRMAMGASVRTSAEKMPNTISAGSGGLPFLSAWYYPNTFLFQLGFILTSSSVVGPYPDGVLTVSDFDVRLTRKQDFNSTATVSLSTPYADPMLGFQPDIPSSNPREDWDWHQWAVTFKSSSYNFATGAFTSDGEIEVFLDGVSQYSASGLSMKAYAYTPSVALQFYPCGDMDGCWVTNTNVLPTFAGAQEVPSSDYLQQYFNFNDEVRPPAGYSIINILGFSPVALDGTAINGLDGTPGISINTLDVTATNVLTGGNSYVGMHSAKVNLGDIIISESGGCVAPAITTQPIDVTIQPADLVTLTVVASGTGPLFYQWYVGETGDTSNPIVGAIAATYSSDEIIATTSFWARISNECSMTDADTVTVTVTVEQPEPPVPGDGSTRTEAIRWVRRSPTVFSDGKRILHRRFQCDFMPGQGLPVAEGEHDRDPIVLVRTSDDGGFTWSSFRQMTLGAQGQYLKQMKLYQLGSSYGRVYEVSGDSPTSFCLVQAWLDIDGTDH